jgi:hypothetical protein
MKTKETRQLFFTAVEGILISRNIWANSHSLKGFSHFFEKISSKGRVFVDLLGY